MLAIIDMDVLCYQCCESRWKLRCNLNNEMVIQLDEAGNRKQLEFTKSEDSKYLRQCWDRFQKDHEKILESVYATDYVGAVKAPDIETINEDGTKTKVQDNFRNLLYPEYKMNRHKDPNKQNLFVPILRKLAAAEEIAIEAKGREADDLLRIWAEEARAADRDYIICTIDKDLKCIPGRHYDMRIDTPDHKRIIEISESEALRHYYTQLLKGDPGDNIPGVPRIGDVKAAKLIARLNDEYAYQECVVNEYINAYGEHWLEYLNSNGKMLYLQRHPDDYFNCLEWEVVKELLEE
jgi:hypothetical protein